MSVKNTSAFSGTFGSRFIRFKKLYRFVDFLSRMSGVYTLGDFIKHLCFTIGRHIYDLIGRLVYLFEGFLVYHSSSFISHIRYLINTRKKF